eukprot:gene10323-12209_t
MIDWKRAELVLKAKMDETDGKEAGHKRALFAGGIDPADIGQGQLGDCWLLSAFACLAEIPGAVKRVFVSKQYSRYGKYTVRLFDKVNNKWLRISVDDYIPCEEGTCTPLFAQPNGLEVWVMILEKAFAKFVGSYDKLEGGHPLWALEALTGDAVMKYSID